MAGDWADEPPDARLAGRNPLVKSVIEGAAVAAALAVAGVPHLWVTDPKQPDNKHRAGSTDEAVVLSTIHSAKGLEYPHVIVCGLGVWDDQTTDRKLLYVGFTRATHDLTVVTHRGSPFCRSLVAAR